MSKKVLIVDDAYFMRNLLKKHLKEAGYEVIGEAKNGKEGIKFYFELKPDFVTMDINMPDISGIDVTKEILSKDPNALIIAVTGNNNDEIKKQILEAGAKEYLQKPFQPAYLWNKLDKMLEPPIIQEAEETPFTEVEAPIKLSTDKVIVAEAVEDDFDNLELEILDKPNENKPVTLVIENDEDIIEYPETYQTEIKESQENFGLSKDNIDLGTKVDALDELEFELESAREITIQNEEKTILELVDTPNKSIEVVKEFEEEVVAITEQPKIPHLKLEQPKPKLNRPLQSPIASVKAPIKPSVTNRDGNKPIVKPIINPIPAEPVTEPVKPMSKTVITHETVAEKTTNKKGVAEISVHHEGVYKTSSKEIDIRPPRGKFLSTEFRIEGDGTEVEAPILNVSTEDNYNDKNTGLLSVVKKLFKK